MRFKSFLTFANGSCENRQCEKRSPHTWPLWAYTSEHKPDRPIASRVKLKWTSAWHYVFKLLLNIKSVSILITVVHSSYVKISTKELYARKSACHNTW
jgi:hypothetical protein